MAKKTDKAKTSARKPKQYLYIVQSSNEKTKCKIGITNDLKRRLKDYNSITGKSKDETFSYLFTCEVKNMNKIENDIKNAKSHLREQENREMYFYNDALFKEYVDFIKSNDMFVREISIKNDEKKEIVKIVKRTTPSLKDRGLTEKKVLLRAQKLQNNDEFFTRYEDIEKELSMYDIKIWKDNVVFCNCDDAVDKNERKTSAFSLFFLKNFRKLKLKKLICTHYGGGLNLFDQEPKGYIFTKEGYKEIYTKPEGYNGGFEEKISLKILNEEADIVCTNPPFSRSIDYWKYLINSKKKFIIISNISIVLTTAYFNYFKNKKVWAGYNEIDVFLNAKKEETRAAGYWFTNIHIKNRTRYKQLKMLPLKEIPEKYKKYDDSKTLLVDNSYIPNDYKKPFAVSTRPILNGILEKGYIMVNDKEYRPYINGKECYSRIMIQKK